MGLDLSTKDGLHVALGSYRMVHIFRKQLLIAYTVLRWRGQQFRQDVLDILKSAGVSVYPTWTPDIELTKPFVMDTPDYALLRKVDERTADPLLFLSWLSWFIRTVMAITHQPRCVRSAKLSVQLFPVLKGRIRMCIA